MSSEQTPLAIRHGTCYAIYAFDVGSSIDLDAAQALMDAPERQTVQQKRRAPEYFEYRPAPLRVTESAAALDIGAFRTGPVVEMVMYDFGAISLSWAIPIDGPFSGLVTLAASLRSNASLVNESRQLVKQLVDALGSAVDKPRIASLVEDYVVFQLDQWEPALDAAGIYARFGREAAQILRAETRPLSDQESDQATTLRGSFGPGDLTIVDTDAALVFDPDAADVRAVIEFANAQILEMRFLDQQLDTVLERAYDLLAQQQRPRRFLGIRNPEPWIMAQLQLDAAILFERVTNSLKLIGEQYLTRIYGLISHRFHLSAWDASINRKLQTLESIYEKMTTRASSRRMEVLEWIIILLFALDIILPFLTGFSRK